ncbi:toxin-antitoxin system HicB family antitoxin [Orrella sp. 11846]|uniref:toxin-antitoxin system HicB family antitoxin n=1 Tax=Orrella sp. 11846 TaxID=3409913 RepID=UPI003B5CB045
MKHFDPSLYTIEIKRIDSPDGLLYEAKAKEVPGVAGYAECAADAFEEAREALVMLYEIAKEQGREFPAPLPSIDSNFNGRVTLRMSKSLHHQATLVAENEGVSLNSIIVEALSERVFSNHQLKSFNKEVFAKVLFERMHKSSYQISEGSKPDRLRPTESQIYDIQGGFSYVEQAYSN